MKIEKIYRTSICTTELNTPIYYTQKFIKNIYIDNSINVIYKGIFYGCIVWNKLSKIVKII